MLQELQPLPPFELTSIRPSFGGHPEFDRTLSNADFAGRAFVIFIYPKDATSGCTLEAQEFAALHQEFKKLEVEVVGLSRDALSAHRKFVAAHNLPFALLSDKEQHTLRAWNLIEDATMYGKPVTKVARTTILVDSNGSVRRIWRKVSPPGHAAEVLQAARELVADKVETQ